MSPAAKRATDPEPSQSNPPVPPVRLFPSVLLAIALGLAAGCGSSTDATLDPAGLEAAFKDAPPDAKVEAPAGEESTTDTVVISPGMDVPVKELATRAAAAMKKDEVTEAMVLLQTLRRARNLSPDQLTAVQDQMAAVQADLANKAASGDAKAQQALKLLQQSTRW